MCLRVWVEVGAGAGAGVALCTHVGGQEAEERKRDREYI